jgi:hypothetical protein
MSHWDKASATTEPSAATAGAAQAAGAAAGAAGAGTGAAGAEASAGAGASEYQSHTRAPKEQPFFHRTSTYGSFDNKKPNLYSKNFTVTDPVNWSKNLRAQVPTLLQVGRPTPKAVLSFGGCGMLVTYSLGVAQYLLAEKREFVRQCYVLGTGSGTIAAVALCAEDPKSTPEQVKDFIVANAFDVHHEDTRRKVVADACARFLPDDVHERMRGRCTLAVGMSNRDLYYAKQPSAQQLFGAMISSFDSKADVGDCILAATAPNATLPCVFRGEHCTRATWKCLSAELDQYVRHVYIHGMSGYPHSIHHTRHNTFVGRHGLLANSHWHWQRQMLAAIWPKRIPLLASSNLELIKESFEKGFHDARRYERWEEDVYVTAKPDRSPSDSIDLRRIRAAIFGSRSAAPPDETKL